MQEEEFKKRVLTPIDEAELEKMFGIPETALDLVGAIREIIKKSRGFQLYGSVSFGLSNPGKVYLDSSADTNIVFQVALALNIPVEVKFANSNEMFTAEFDAGEIDKEFAGLKLKSISMMSLFPEQ